MPASKTRRVLEILAEDDNYGYGHLRPVGELSDGEFEWTDGMRYLALLSGGGDYPDFRSS